MPLRIVFLGTPEFAVPSFEILLEAGYDIVAVITAPDRLGGRGGHQLIESAVKRVATSRKIPVLQPTNLKNPGFVETLRSFKADIQVVVAFRMLPEVVWNMPPLGTMNLHGSLLPAYRGAAPINWAIINGESQTGVTTFMLQHAIDTGDILLQKSLEIGPDETAGELHDRMMILGAQTVLESIQGLESHSLIPFPQDASQVSAAPKLTHGICQINFNQPARLVHNFVRGLSPHPAAWTILDGFQFNVFRTQVISEQHNHTPGVILVSKDSLEVTCGSEKIKILEVQLQGKRRMQTKDFLNGYRIQSTVVGPST